ncbi:MAG: DHH family phosphoesterase [bacterium]|nr:DHH family phosphoesterase [bacterium]
MQKEWRLKQPQESPLEISGKHLIAGTLLAQRGIDIQEKVDAFFRPNWEADIHDPFLFSQMKNAVERTFLALKSGERITVHGDYDADGVTGSTVVIATLREIARAMSGVDDPASSDTDVEVKNKNREPCIDFYIPHRDEEGYGLHIDTIPILKQRGTTLLITVDCGIACVDEIALAKEEGIDTIVLDHHRFGDELPNGILIHPSIPNETYPYKNLAAVGVAWKFASALVTHARENGFEIKDGWEKWLLDLVAIATVTDMVPLDGENRTLLHYGLLVLNKTRRPGLESIIDASRITLGSITSETVGFTIGPRINAAGRMEHASHALELLLATEAEDAKERAGKLETLNRLRQTRTRGMMVGVDAELADTEVGSVIALYDPTWSPALVGLVAGRVADRYARPCIAIGKHGEKWIGSGRAPDPVNITELVQKAGKGLLTRSGGHAQACGFGLDRDEDVEVFVKRFREMGETIRGDLPERPILQIDAELQLKDITWDLWNTLVAFEPFGMGNPRPIFCSRGLRVVSADRVGKQQDHLRMVLTDADGRSRSFIAFRLGERYGEVELGSCVDVVYDVSENMWNGRRDLSCRIVDFQKA